MADRPLYWLGTSLDDLKGFHEDARRAAGYQLRRVQKGLEPTDWKPMTSIGSGVREIRIRTRLQHRILYLVHIGEAVYVLHAFEKKSQKTPRRDLAVAQSRLKQLRQIFKG